MDKLDKIISKKLSKNSDTFNGTHTSNRERLYNTFKLMSKKSKFLVIILIWGVFSCIYFSITNTVEIMRNYPLMRKIESSVNTDKQEIADKQESEEEPKPPSDWVQVPNTSFKSKEEVTILFEQAGLKPLFVPQHIEFEADINHKNISIGTTISIEPQPNVQYFSGDFYGYYAPKGSEVIVGYSPVDYQYRERN